MADVMALPALGLRTDYLSSDSPLRAFQQGRQDGIADEQRNLLKEVGGIASTGNYLEASRRAMAGGDVKTGVDISNWDLDRRKSAYQFLVDGVQRADTPEKYQTLVDMVSKNFGPDMVRGYESFDKRPSAITALQKAEMQFKQAGQDSQIAAQGAQTAESRARLPLIEAQTQALKQKDVLNEAIANLVTRNLGQAGQPTQQPSQPAPQGASPIQPQSNTQSGGATLQPASDGPPNPMGSSVTTTDPSLILAQAAPGQGALPPQQLAPPDQIDTPFGRMSRDQARQLGGALALAGKGDAGKMLTDAANAGAGTQWGKEGGNELDKKQINAVNHIARLKGVEAAFDPKFLQIPKRINMAWTSLKARVKDIPETEAQSLSDYAEFRRATVENINRLLNELSGAAVSPQEADRLKASQPDAGTGILDGDDPVTFQTKLKGVVRDQKRAIARYNYMRQLGPNAGNPWDVMPLEEIDRVINKRGAEIEKEIRSKDPKASPAVIDMETKARLNREFGLSI